MRILLFQAMFFLLLFSCNSTKEDKDKKYISKKIEQLMPTMNKCFEKVVVLPGSGCPGCITVAEDYLKENYRNKNILFVLTNTQSFKLLSQRVGTDVLKLSNAYVDESDVISKPISLIYPVMILYNCTNDKVSNVNIQQPGNDAF